MSFQDAYMQIIHTFKVEKIELCFTPPMWRIQGCKLMTKNVYYYTRLII